ncbi:HTH-type transcriptional regulator YofA [compost metagenome]
MSIKVIHDDMTLSQDQLKAFYEVSRRQSFTKAANELGLTQSALSHRIRKLEEQLETTLFVRDPSGIRLTEAGANLLEFCRLQSQLETEFLSNLMSPSDKTMKGHLRIGGASTVLWSAVVPALSEFLIENGSIQFEMIEDELKHLPDLLQTGRVDMIVTCGKVDRNNFEGFHLGEEVNILIEAKKTRPGAEIYLDHDANDQMTINFLKHQGQRKAKIERRFMDNINGIIAGVEAGLGKAVMPKHLIKGMKNIKPVSDQKELRDAVYLYTLKQPFYSKLHTAVIKELTEKVGTFLK